MDSYCNVRLDGAMDLFVVDYRRITSISPVAYPEPLINFDFKARFFV